MPARIICSSGIAIPQNPANGQSHSNATATIIYNIDEIFTSVLKTGVFYYTSIKNYGFLTYILHFTFYILNCLLRTGADVLTTLRGKIVGSHPSAFVYKVVKNINSGGNGSPISSGEEMTFCFPPVSFVKTIKNIKLKMTRGVIASETKQSQNEIATVSFRDLAMTNKVQILGGNGSPVSSGEEMTFCFSPVVYNAVVANIKLITNHYSLFTVFLGRVRKFSKFFGGSFGRHASALSFTNNYSPITNNCLLLGGRGSPFFGGSKTLCRPPICFHFLYILLRCEGKISEEPQFATYTQQEQIAERPQGSVSKKFVPELPFRAGTDVLNFFGGRTEDACQSGNFPGGRGCPSNILRGKIFVGAVPRPVECNRKF